MTGARDSPPRVGFYPAVLVARLVAAIAVTMFEPSIAAAAMTLEVEASNGLPGFHRDELQRYLALHMAEEGLGEWRFEPATVGGTAANRVEWTFKLNPYAGGAVRNFARMPLYDGGVGAGRSVTIEARLYLNGEYQTLVERQAVIWSGANDSEFAAAVASTAQALLGPSGAYHAIDSGKYGASRNR